MRMLLFFSVIVAVYSIRLTSSFLIQYSAALFWMLVVAWWMKIFFSCWQLFLINVIIFGFYLIFLRNSLNWSSSLSLSVTFYRIFVTAESKVSPFIMKVDVCINWIALNRIAMNCGNLMPWLSRSRVSSKDFIL